jgi:thymidylate synthase
MKIIVEDLGQAHEAMFDAILETHREISIQTHVNKKEFTLEFRTTPGQDDFLTVEVLYPQNEPQISPGASYGELLADAYRKQFLTLSPPNDGKEATYTYYNRLADYPHLEDASEEVYDASEGDVTSEWVGDGDGRGYNQLQELIKKLAGDWNSRRGVMVTWNPMLDATSREPPCMDMIQCVIRDKFLFMRIVFRSQDWLSAGGENLIGCSAFQQYIVNGINNISDGCCTCGSMTIISLIPHIYSKRDGDEFDKMRKHIAGKKSLRQWKVRTE